MAASSAPGRAAERETRGERRDTAPANPRTKRRDPGTDVSAHKICVPVPSLSERLLGDPRDEPARPVELFNRGWHDIGIPARPGCRRRREGERPSLPGPDTASRRRDHGGTNRVSGTAALAARMGAWSSTPAKMFCDRIALGSSLLLAHDGVSSWMTVGERRNVAARNGRERRITAKTTTGRGLDARSKR